MKRYLEKCLVILTLISSLSIAQDINDTDFKALRDEQIKRLGMNEMPNVKEIMLEADSFMNLSLEEQSIKSLEKIAKETNKAANMVDFIYKEYESYYSDNYKYDFVQKKVAPFLSSYLKLKNDLIRHRNQAYYNLGVKYQTAGNDITAFFYYNDAFRLSAFDEDKGDHKGLRYKSEIKMKELLGLESVETFIYWK